VCAFLSYNLDTRPGEVYNIIQVALNLERYYYTYIALTYLLTLLTYFTLLTYLLYFTCFTYLLNFTYVTYLNYLTLLTYLTYLLSHSLTRRCQHNFKRRFKRTRNHSLLNCWILKCV